MTKRLLILLLALLLPASVSAQVPNVTGVKFTNTDTLMTAGAGSPEGVVVGAPGNIYISTNGSVYSKAAGSGTDNSGWVALGGGGSGTMTSLGITAPSFLSVSGSPVTTSGTIALSLATQSAKTFFAGPTSGSAAQPGFRTMGTDDLPVCASTKIYKSDGSAMVCDDDAGASSGAPSAAQYITLAIDATLSNERVITEGTGIDFVDAGAGSTLTVKVDASEIDTGTLPVAQGGTNLTAASDDNVMVGNATTWQSKAVADCDDTGGNHLNYDTGTNAFSCGTSGGGSGAVVQVKNYQTGAVATGTTLIPADDTIPQNTEGTEFMTLAITPTNASNKLVIQVHSNLTSHTATRYLIAALFQDSTANALAASWYWQQVADGSAAVGFTYVMTAGTTSATTFKVRGGTDQASTITLNGGDGARFFGGVMMSSITITEVVP